MCERLIAFRLDSLNTQIDSPASTATIDVTYILSMAGLNLERTPYRGVASAGRDRLSGCPITPVDASLQAIEPSASRLPDRSFLHAHTGTCLEQGARRVLIVGGNLQLTYDSPGQRCAVSPAALLPLTSPAGRSTNGDYGQSQSATTTRGTASDGICPG